MGFLRIIILIILSKFKKIFTERVMVRDFLIYKQSSPVDTKGVYSI